MRSVIRPSMPEDAPAITALLAERNLRPDTSLQALHWKYWLPRADFPDPRSFVTLRGDRLVAHAALIPGTFRGGNSRQRTAHVIDWVARSGEWGAGTTLMKHVGQQVESLLAIGAATIPCGFFLTSVFVGRESLRGMFVLSIPCRYCARSPSVRGCLPVCCAA